FPLAPSDPRETGPGFGRRHHPRRGISNRDSTAPSPTGPAPQRYRTARRSRWNLRHRHAHHIQAVQEKGVGVKITEKEVRYVADLANLKLTGEEIERLAKDLDEILTHIDTLNELDTSKVEPMAQVLYDAEETATLREDRE